MSAERTLVVTPMDGTSKRLQASSCFVEAGVLVITHGEEGVTVYAPGCWQSAVDEQSVETGGAA